MRTSPCYPDEKEMPVSTTPDGPREDQPESWASSPPTYAAPSGVFFHALFDLTFSRFVTVSFAKLIYIIAIAIIAVGYLLVVIGSLAAEPTRGVVVLLVGWVPALVYVIVVRVGLELAVAIVKTAQNTSVLAGRQD